MKIYMYRYVATFHKKTCYLQQPSACFKIKLGFCWWRKSHCGNIMMLGTSYLHIRIPSPRETISLHWISPRIVGWTNTILSTDSLRLSRQMMPHDDFEIFLIFFFASWKLRNSVHNSALVCRPQLKLLKLRLDWVNLRPQTLIQWNSCTLHTDGQPSYWLSHWAFNKYRSLIDTLYWKKTIWALRPSINNLSPVRCQAIIWTNAGLLSIRPLATNFNEIWIKIQQF